MRVAPLFWEWPRIEEEELTTESQTWPWPLIYQRQDWKHMVSLNSPWVWCHPIFWVVNRGFVCTVCPQVSQSWGRGFHRGPSSGHCCFNIFINDLNYAVPDVSLRLYADDTTLYASDVSPIAVQFVVNRCLSRLSEWVRYKLFADKQCQDASPSDRSLQVRFWLNFELFWRY